MTINKVKWPGLLVILSFAALSVFGFQSSFAPAATSKEETLKLLSSYRTWDRINKQPLVSRADRAVPV